MPRPRRSNSRQSRNARIRNTANERTEEEQEIAREQRRVSMARLRASQSQQQSEAARETARLAMQNRRANNRSQQIDNLRRRTRDLSSADLDRAAFRYDCSNDYSLHPSIQGQIHHRIGSLLPIEDTEHKFLQIYFIGNMEEQLDRRREINAGIRIPYSRTSSHCCAFGGASGEWSTSTYHGFECYATC
ncbi:putative DNA helicase [Trichonephila inaurata madagascariensis]|uniref:Putative DNA helicase n=1 Tax=Trichonephila inaurata madagascariensis TaxID=2747483 RepID=A0A8X6MFK5_9ARAC|nr:putative DNA helicase [Trichonephila inaurata madagascariensis]